MNNTLAPWKSDRLRSQRSLVQDPGLDSDFKTRNQFSIMSGQGWLGPMHCIVKWVKKVSSGGVVDFVVEQPQLFRKLHKNKQSKHRVPRKISDLKSRVVEYFTTMDN